MTKTELLEKAKIIQTNIEDISNTVSPEAWFIMGCLILTFVYFTNRIRSKNKDLQTQIVSLQTNISKLGQVQLQQLPIVYDIFDKVVSDKMKYYATQIQSDLSRMNEAEIKQLVTIIVNDILISLSDDLKEQLKKIYTEKTLDLIIKQRVLQTLYLIDKKLNEETHNLEGVID